MSGDLPTTETQPETDSPASGESVFLAVGKLRRPHGVRGDILLEVFTDFPERLAPGVNLYVGDEHKPLRLIRARNRDNLLILRFSGYITPEQVNELTNQILYVKAAEIPALPEGEYYHHQLVGLNVTQDTGEPLGSIAEVIETGANDVLVVKLPSGKELLLPWNNDVICQVDLGQKLITVHLIPGLLED